MRGNRATRTSGLVRALRFFHPRGVHVGEMSRLFCFNCLYARSLSFLPANPTPSCARLPLQSFPFPHNSVSTAPRNLVPLVSLLTCPICVVCHSVNVYWLSSPFAHCNSPFIRPSVHSAGVRALRSASVGLSCSPSGMDSPLPPHSFSRGRRLRHVRDPSV
jgi:hypothetical protein